MASHTRIGRHGTASERVARDRFFREHGWTAVPRLVQWMVTSDCPLSCPHCLASAGTAWREEMALRDGARLIEAVAALGVEEFLLTGGEPLARADLPEVIDVLRINRVRWSLNTAMAPSRPLRRSMERWPPTFVAVSLDGPEEVHDRFRGQSGAFREALDSLAYFSTLVPAGVAAGTTVTTWNVASLPATFGIVLESGASQWGLHLPVPEGRAAGRPDLFLSRNQLTRLLRFAAAKRNHFPVIMADEIGYCGAWEPLVRDGPFFCGAGRAQCVVLPDGEVVPCTTMDRRASAGNIRTRPLGEIWRDGFAELRNWTPAGKCADCRFAVACGGGCWLQRRHGTQCFKDVWRAPLTSRAALAVCVGLAAAGLASDGQAREREARSRPAIQREMDARKMEVLQRHIIQWYAAQVGGRRAPTLAAIKTSAAATLPADPGFEYFRTFIAADRPMAFAIRAGQVQRALKTRQRSLCLIGLAWRDITEWCLDGTPPAERTAEERRVLRETMAGLAATADAWRTEIFREKLDPFLRRTSDYRRFFRSKAGPPTDVNLWGRAAHKRGWTNRDMTEAFVEAHPYAEVMILPFEAVGVRRLKCLRRGKEVAADGKLGVFDLLVVPKKAEGKPAKLRFELNAGIALETTLPPGAELSYGDVLRLTSEQNRQALDSVTPKRLGVFRGQRVLALPALRRMQKDLQARKPTPETAARLRVVMWHLIDIYLF